MWHVPHTQTRRVRGVSKILRNATSYNRAQLGVLEGCPLVLLGRVWEGLAPSKKAWSSWVYFRSCATYYVLLRKPLSNDSNLQLLPWYLGTGCHKDYTHSSRDSVPNGTGLRGIHNIT